MKTKIITLIAFSILVAFTLPASAQNKRDTLTNQIIIQLKKAGLGSDLIKTKIQGSMTKFDLSTDALIALKKAGVPDDIVAAMLNKASATTTSSESEYGTENEKDPGIYYCKGKPCEFTKLDPSVYSQSKAGSGILTGLTYGIVKTKVKSTLSSLKANLQVDANPTFYFHFDKNHTGKGVFETATSPNEFLLVKFTVTKKAREVVMGSLNYYAGMSSGVDDNNRVPFKYEKVSHGIYKVYTEQPLEKGEYGFMYAGATSSFSGGTPLQKVYDFGIH